MVDSKITNADAVRASRRLRGACAFHPRDEPSFAEERRRRDPSKKTLLYFLQDGHNATHFYHYHYYYYITLARFLSASIAV